MSLHEYSQVQHKPYISYSSSSATSYHFFFLFFYKVYSIHLIHDTKYWRITSEKWKTRSVEAHTTAARPRAATLCLLLSLVFPQKVEFFLKDECVVILQAVAMRRRIWCWAPEAAFDFNQS